MLTENLTKTAFSTLGSTLKDKTVCEVSKCKHVVGQGVFSFRVVPANLHPILHVWSINNSFSCPAQRLFTPFYTPWVNTSVTQSLANFARWLCGNLADSRVPIHKYPGGECPVDICVTVWCIMAKAILLTSGNWSHLISPVQVKQQALGAVTHVPALYLGSLLLWVILLQR